MLHLLFMAHGRKHLHRAQEGNTEMAYDDHMFAHRLLHENAKASEDRDDAQRAHDVLTEVVLLIDRCGCPARSTLPVTRSRAVPRSKDPGE